MDRLIEDKNRKWKKRVSVLLIPVLLGLAYLLVHSFAKRTVRADEDSLQFAVVEQGNFEEFIVVTGTVEPLKTIIVVALEGGIVEEKYLEDGSRVKEGDLLLKLSNQDLLRECMNQETALLDQLNNLRNSRIIMEQSSFNYRQQFYDLEKDYLNAQTVYEANVPLYRDKLIAEQEFLQSERLFHSLEKRYHLLKKASDAHNEFKDYQSLQLDFSASLIRRSLDNLRSSLDKLVLRAPASGLLTGLNAERGQHILKGEKVAEVDLLQGYRIHARVDQMYISRVKKGLHARVRFGNKELLLVVDKIYPQVTEGQFRVDLLFESSENTGLKYGQSVQVKMSLGEPAPSLLLQRGSFIQKTAGTWVFVVAGNTATRRNTSFGRQNPSYLEVLSGLKKGEKVIISSYDGFDNADEIYINSR